MASKSSVIMPPMTPPTMAAVLGFEEPPPSDSFAPLGGSPRVMVGEVSVAAPSLLVESSSSVRLSDKGLLSLDGDGGLVSIEPTDEGVTTLLKSESALVESVGCEVLVEVGSSVSDDESAVVGSGCAGSAPVGRGVSTRK